MIPSDNEAEVYELLSWDLPGLRDFGEPWLPIEERINLERLEKGPLAR